MATEPAPPPPAEEETFPQPVVTARERRSVWLFWLLPIVAIAAAAWLGIHALLDRGPVFTIEFRTADGLEAGKTRLKYKDVDIGRVRTIDLTPDHSKVVVTAELNGGLDSLLAEDTKFWTVRPRIAATGITGLGTLFSGVYIGVDIGKSTTRRRDFVGLELPPAVTTDLPGRQFTLRAYDLGSLEIGSPVYFRRVSVGQVVSYEIDPDGRNVTVQVFVNAPYDRFVSRSTRFWQASGIDVSIDTSGLKVDMESIASLVIGAVAFDTPLEAGSPIPQEAPQNARFRLAADRGEAYRRPDVGGSDYVMLFKGSVRGLNVGAPVDLRGISLGEVTDIRINFAGADKDMDMAVFVRVYPERLRTMYRTPQAETSPELERKVLDGMVQRGLRAQLRTGSLLTGQLYVALDFFPGTRAAHVDWSKTPPEVPTVPGTFDSLEQSLVQIASKLENVPFEKLGNDADQTLRDLNKAIVHADAALTQIGATVEHADKVVGQLSTGIAPETQAMLQEARRALETANRTFSSLGESLGSDSALQSNARRTLADVSSAARALRVLADYLERHPESLLRGKPEDSP